MDKPKLTLSTRDNRLIIRVQCCIEHAWITTTMQVEIINNKACVILKAGEINGCPMAPSEGERFAGHLRFLSVVAEVINSKVADKTADNIRAMFTIETQEQIKLCQEISVLH